MDREQSDLERWRRGWWGTVGIFFMKTSDGSDRPHIFSD